MYFGILKLQFNSEGWPEADWPKACRATAERISRKFKILAKTAENGEPQTGTLIMIGLHRSRSQLINKFDEVAAFCESSDLGRVMGEDVLMESIDTLMSEGHEEPQV